MHEGLREKAIELGAAAAQWVDSGKIVFSQEFRDACQRNYCGKFGTNWMCPPAVASMQECIEEVRGYTKGLVFQTVTAIEDSFDFEGMQQAAKNHTEVYRTLHDHIHAAFDKGSYMALNAGECTYCESCSYPTGEPCRFPDKAVSSLEAHCIDVNALVTACSIPYINGQNTVSYVGMFLFR